MADKSLKLSIVVAAQDLASGKLSNVNKQLRGMNTAGKAATLGLGSMIRVGNRAAGAFSSLKSRVTGLSGAFGGLIGVGAGLGLTAFFTDSIKKAEDFGAATLRLRTIIGGTTEEVSGLVDTLGDWGVKEEDQQKILGFGEKAIFKYTKSAKDAKKFQTQFGVSLVDAKGKVVGMTEVLRRSSRFLASNASAAQKNAAMAALFGKGWQKLIPIIGHGQKFFDEQFGSADKLTGQQLKDIRALSTAQQSFNDKLDRLKVSIGLAIIPELTKVTRTLGTFVEKNKAGILGAVRGAIALGGQIAGAFGQVIGGLRSAWSAVPKPLQELLIKGFVADRTFKFLFGFSPAKLILETGTSLIAKGLGGILGSIFSRGTPMPVVVTNPGALGGGGAPGGTGGLGSKVVQAVSIVAIAAEAFAVFKSWQDVNAQSTAQANDLAKQQNDWLKKGASRDDITRGLAAVDQGIAEIRNNPLLTLVQGEALNRLESMDAQLRQQLAHMAAETATGRAIVNGVNSLGPRIGQAFNSGGIISAVLALIPHIDNISLRVNGGGVTRTKSGQNAHTGRHAAVTKTPRVGIEKNRHAAGLLGMTKGTTDLGIAGEAGKEAVAIVKSPKPIKGKSGLPVYVTNWPSGGGSGTGGDTGTGAAKWHVRRLGDIHSPAHAAALRPAVHVHTHVAVSHSARDTVRAEKRYHRVGNGAGVSLD